MKITRAASTLTNSPPNLSFRNSGIVIVSRFCVMRRVRLPSTSQAAREPRAALPTAIHSTFKPNFHPSLPAKPMKRTAEK